MEQVKEHDLEALGIAVKHSDSPRQALHRGISRHRWEADVLPASVIGAAIDAAIETRLDDAIWNVTARLSARATCCARPIATGPAGASRDSWDSASPSIISIWDSLNFCGTPQLGWDFSEWDSLPPARRGHPRHDHGHAARRRCRSRAAPSHERLHWCLSGAASLRSTALMTHPPMAPKPANEAAKAGKEPRIEHIPVPKAVSGAFQRVVEGLPQEPRKEEVASPRRPKGEFAKQWVAWANNNEATDAVSASDRAALLALSADLTCLL